MNTAAKRLHELPYSYQHNGQFETGYIDALYLQGGEWTLVDFKTDSVRDETALQQLLDKKDYFQQVQQYGAAVEKLLGITPRLMLWFLNCTTPDSRRNFNRKVKWGFAVQVEPVSK